MRLYILLIFLFSTMLNSWALIVITDPYAGLDYEEIAVYPETEINHPYEGLYNPYEECQCPH